MRARESVTSEKLRGGFYSPDVLVEMCLDRAQALLGSRRGLRVLEPASGDGAFIRGLDRHPLGAQVGWVEAVEVQPEEAEACRRSMSETMFDGRVVTANVLEWNERDSERFDLAVSNPPYVRYQFVSPQDRQRALSLAAELGIIGSAVSNLWIPVFLLTVDRLRCGGVFSAILPSEFLTGVSAGRVRSWLLDATRDLHIDLFKPGSFPAVLQEVLVLTGRKAASREARSNSVRFTDHNGGSHSWEHLIEPAAKTWTGYLLAPSQVEAFVLASALPEVQPMRNVARFTVSTVTGANSYFCVDGDTVGKFGLAPWVIPLLPKARHAAGIEFTADDHGAASSAGAPAWLLTFAADRPSPLASSAPRMYIENGEAARLHERFKCRIREPWFRVPVVAPGQLMMSKRSNLFPRVILNRAGVVTTDTIYRGQMVRGATIGATDVAGAFHNSLTLLSAEIEGRSFGGGVLELVPSEIASLAIPVVQGAGRALGALDRVARGSPHDAALIDATDQALLRSLPELRSFMPVLREARYELAGRRLMRTKAGFFEAC